MSVTFENSFYKIAYTNKSPFDSNYFKEYPQFKYKEPTFLEYGKVYDDSGWFGRKIIAIPLATWSAVVEVLYHLAKAIFGGLPKFPMDRGLYFKAQIFSVLRDLQEALGRLTTILSDSVGLYYIEQAQFYKSCYECFLAETRVTPSPSNENHPSPQTPQPRNDPTPTTNPRALNQQNLMREQRTKELTELNQLMTDYFNKKVELENKIASVRSKIKHKADELKNKIKELKNKPANTNDIPAINDILAENFKHVRPKETELINLGSKKASLIIDYQMKFKLLIPEAYHDKTERENFLISFRQTYPEFGL